MRLLLVFLVTIMLLTSTVVIGESLAKSKDSKAKSAIIKAIGRATEGKYSSVKMLNMTTFALPNSTVTVYNKSGGVSPSPPPPVITCMTGWHYDPILKECVQDNVPPPPPPVSGFKLCMAGDFNAGSNVPAAMKKQCNFTIALGDCGYQSDLSWCKSQNFDKGVLGNHEAIEDGNAQIQKEALAYFGNSWWITLGNDTLILGFNTNGNIDNQLKAASSVVSSHSGLKNVIALSHKNGHVFPNAHHPAEAVDLYSQLEQLVPHGITLWEVSGHNHDNAAAPTKNWYIAGAGGKSFYSCGTDADWTFCDNTHKAFLQFTIDNQGTITPNFIDSGGKVIFPTK